MSLQAIHTTGLAHFLWCSCHGSIVGHSVKWSSTPCVTTEDPIHMVPLFPGNSTKKLHSLEYY